MSYKKQKVTGNSTGSNEKFMKNGYAATKPPSSMIPGKLGKGPGVAYSGPNIVKKSRSDV